MSKRSTTGQPRAAQPKPEVPVSQRPIQQRLLREYSTKAERENTVQRLVILGTGAIIALAVVIFVISLIGDQLIRPNQAVANVNGETITVRQFEDRARLERALLSERLNEAISLFQSIGYSGDQLNQAITQQQPYSTWWNELNVPDQLGNRVLNDMVNDTLVAQKARELGVDVTDEEVQTKVNEFFGYDPTLGVGDPTATPSPTMTPTPIVSPTPSPEPTATLPPTATATPDPVTPTALPSATPQATSTAIPTLTVTERAEAFETQQSDFYNLVRSSARVGDEQINAYFRAEALREKVRDAVLTDVPMTDTFVNARHILVAEQVEAQNAVDALNAGESFAALAAAISTDGSAASGGGLGWAQADRYVTEFADAIRGAAIGAIVGPVQTQFGFHIIQVLGREERPIEDADYQVKLDTEFSDYLTELRTAEGTDVQTFDTWADNVPQEPRFVPRGV